MKRELTKARNQGYRIVYIDETMITRKTVANLEWSRPKENMAIDVAKLEEPTLAVLCGISKENGLEHYGVYKNCVDQIKFADYLDELYIANKHEKIAVLMDNFSAHKTNSILQKMDELEIRCIYNVPYQPDYNPTEACFSKIKNYYKRQKLNQLVREEEIDVNSLIEQSVN